MTQGAMRMFKRAYALAFAVILVSACGSSSSSPTAPTPGPAPAPAAAPAPAPTAFALTGLVTDATTSAPIAGAAVSILDPAPHPNAGRSTTTDASGRYNFAALQRSGFTISATIDDYNSAQSPVTLASDQTANLQISRLYEGSWTAPSPASGGGGLGRIDFSVKNGSIVSIGFSYVVVASGRIALCFVDASVDAPIVRGAFRIPISSAGFSTTLTGTFTSPGGGRGTVGNISLNRFQCGLAIFTGSVSAGGEFLFSR